MNIADAVLQRLNSAADYFSVPRVDRAATASFAKECLFDFLDCRGLSVWKMNEGGEWFLLAQSGELEMPEGHSEWSSLNRQTLGLQHAKRLSIEGGYHWVLPLRTAQGRNFVFHLQGSVGEPVELVMLYLSICGKYLVSEPHPVGTQQREIQGLSSRQVSILTLMSKGRTYLQIAEELGYSESLIKQEAVRMFKRIGVKSRYEAIDFYMSLPGSASDGHAQASRNGTEQEWPNSVA